MSAQLIDGKALSLQIQAKLLSEVQSLIPIIGRPPCLAVVLVGENPASKVYVRSKTKAAIACGMNVIDVPLEANISDARLQQKLGELSSDPLIDGILLQLPLPKGLDEYRALLAISPEKDVDGLHPFNQGLLLRGVKTHQPCTPLGVMHLIDKGLQQLGCSTDLSGKHAVVVGRSILVGKPAAMLLLSRNCTVEICHSKTVELEAECRRADILVAAIGKARFVTQAFVKPGSIVIDVGINHDEQSKLCGDVDFDRVRELAGAITPVPGGVGPMTIAMLLSNTVEAARPPAIGK